MRSVSALLFVLILMCTTVATAFGAEPHISVKAEVDRAFMTIGDRVNFRITVTHDPKMTLLEVDARQELANFEIKEVTDFSYRRGGEIHEGKNYVITNYELGEYVIRPLAIAWKSEDGRSGKLQTNSLYVTVQSVDQDKDPKTDIRGVKGVHGLKGPLWPRIAALGAVIGIGSALAWYFARKRNALAAREKPAILSPHEEAYQALYRLKHSDYLRKGQYKAYFLEMSEILRRYFQHRYGISAMESTTFELMNNLKEKIPHEPRALIEEVLQLCDFVKFAKYVPSVQEVLKQNKQAHLVVDQTKEVVAEPADVVRPPEPSHATSRERAERQISGET